MFSLDVVGTDNFSDMPTSAQNLYFHLGMRADDDGFIASPRQVAKIINCSKDDLGILVSKGYVIPFESGVVVITDWKINNQIRKDRYTETKYYEEKEILEINPNGSYIIRSDLVAEQLLDGCQMVAKRLSDGCQGGNPGKYRLDKDSVVKDNISLEPDKSAPIGSSILLPLNDKTTYDVPLDKISNWKQAYPNVDVEQELRKMIAWLDSNPSKKKTRRGIDRFINNWLENAQNRGGYTNHTNPNNDRQEAKNENRGPYTDSYI
jgi:hypothetical protein